MNGLTDATGDPLPPEETPSPEVLRAYGDAMFLAFRSPRHAGMDVANLRAAFEPPLVLGQYRIFRFDEVPRAIYTFAFLSPEGERRYVGGQVLRPADWRAPGGRLWLIDIIAPYRGLMASLGRWIMEKGNVSDTGFLFRRIEGERGTRRITEARFENGRKRLIVRKEAEFL